MENIEIEQIDRVDPPTVVTEIYDAIYTAKRHGFPAKRLYLGQTKVEQLCEYISESTHAKFDSIGNSTFAGLKIVESKTPGIQVGI
jgi:hypothetical protein